MIKCGGSTIKSEWKSVKCECSTINREWETRMANDSTPSNFEVKRR